MKGICSVILHYDDFVYGLYLPLIFLTIKAGALYFFKVLVPAIRKFEFDYINHSLPMAFFILATTLAAENAYYSIGRVWPDLYTELGFRLHWVGAFKLALLFGATFAIIGIQKAMNGKAHFWRVMFEAGLLYVAGVVLFAMR